MLLPIVALSLIAYPFSISLGRQQGSINLRQYFSQIVVDEKIVNYVEYTLNAMLDLQATTDCWLARNAVD